MGGEIMYLICLEAIEMLLNCMFYFWHFTSACKMAGRRTLG